MKKLNNEDIKEMTRILEDISQEQYISNAKVINFNPQIYSFKCIKCGHCCRRPLQPYGGYLRGYNYKGLYVENPTRSPEICYFEEKKIRNVAAEKGIQNLKLFPSIILYLKDYHIGFVLHYQLDVKKNGNCIFFNNKIKLCSIYKDRPIICRTFPITYTHSKYLVPNVSIECKAFREALRNQNPEIPFYDESINIKSKGFIYDSFKNQLIEYRRLHQFNIELLYFAEFFRDLFINPENLNFNEIKKYTLLNFDNFSIWLKKQRNLKDYQFKHVEFLKRKKAFNLLGEIFYSEGNEALKEALLKELLNRHMEN